MARDITQLHPRLQLLAEELVDRCRTAGLIVKITDCVRDRAEQEDCVRRGTSSCHYPYSHHNWGTAFDICRNDGKGAYNDSDGWFQKVGKIGQELGLEWGGAWVSPVDTPHFQLPDWGTGVTKLVMQYGLPENFRKTWYTGGPAGCEEYNAMVETFQTWLRGHGFDISVDGYYGPETKKAAVMALQMALNQKYHTDLAVDGSYGPLTKAATRGLEQGNEGALVYILQGLLYCVGENPRGFDGHFGPGTELAVKAVQRSHGITVDGIAGRNTFDCIINK